MTNSSIFRKIQTVLALAMVLALVSVPLYSAQTAPGDHTPVPSSGVVCTTDSMATFTLTAKDGYLSMADGNTVYAWSYALGNGDFQHPGPVLCVNEGDNVTIILHNHLWQDVSMVFPGQENVIANGLPSQPQFDGSNVLVSLAPAAQANGGTITYSFVASKPGTYIYQSGTNPAIQVQMGLFGALIVRPAMGADYVYNRADSQFNPGTEYLEILSEIDPLLHQAIERHEPFDMSTYHARYFLINGRTFPDTLAPNYASWLPAQPYSSLAHIHPFNDDPLSPAYNPLPAAARYIGMGVDAYPFHPHAFQSRVIGRDGSALEGEAAQEDLSYEKFSMNINPGQTTEAIFSWKDVYGWNPEGPEIPVAIPGEQNLVFGPFYGSPYLGNQESLPVGTTSYNQCGEFYHIAHNHALQQITGWAVVLIGQVTFTRIDPPLPNNCP
jgi:FtsP/CotA-like multicopper oxidase with cupredoxin domain